MQAYQRSAANAEAAVWELDTRFQGSLLAFKPVVAEGPKWLLIPSGGVLNLDKDMLTLATCHEVGHFLGGFPFAGMEQTSLDKLGTILSAEGQADYFAAKDCVPRLWADQKIENARFRASIDQAAKSKCDATWPESAQQDLCYRIASVSLRLIAFIYTSSTISFDTPLKEEAPRTLTQYPPPQGRLDTLLAGALCPKRSDDSVIPGLVKSPQGNFGEHSVASEEHAKPFACHGNDQGARPRVWFKPAMPDLPRHDCSKFTNGTQCDGGRLVRCDRTGGITREECQKGCGQKPDGDFDCLEFHPE